MKFRNWKKKKSVFQIYWSDKPTSKPLTMPIQWYFTLYFMWFVLKKIIHSRSICVRTRTCRKLSSEKRKTVRVELIFDRPFLPIGQVWWDTLRTSTVWFDSSKEIFLNKAFMDTCSSPQEPSQTLKTRLDRFRISNAEKCMKTTTWTDKLRKSERAVKNDREINDERVQIGHLWGPNIENSFLPFFPPECEGKIKASFIIFSHVPPSCSCDDKLVL